MEDFSQRFRVGAMADAMNGVGESLFYEIQRLVRARLVMREVAEH